MNKELRLRRTRYSRYAQRSTNCHQRLRSLRLLFYRFRVRTGRVWSPESPKLFTIIMGILYLLTSTSTQILTDGFVEHFPNCIINIHHSFLPAFVGPKPYHQAYQRGVKVIGATSHYVTPELDNGPIIGQDVIHISHRDSVEDLVRKGRDLEKIVLARAVRLHLEDRILAYGNKTVVFE